MKKITAILFLAILFIFVQNTLPKANAESLGLNERLRVEANADNNGVQTQNENEITEQNRNRSQLRLFNDGNNNQEFRIKGTITASSSNSLTINSQVIKIDQSVTGNVKIVGNIQVGMYAMVWGVIKNSNYYAKEIVIDQRNKWEVNENEQGSTPSATPTQALSEREHENASIGAQTKFAVGNITQRLDDLINFLKNWLSSL